MIKNRIPSLIYFGVILFSTLCGIFRFRRLDKASSILFLILPLTLLEEIIALVFTIKRGNNMPVYHIYAPVYLVIVAAYFNTSIDTFKGKKLGIYVGIVSVLLGIINPIFFQPLDTLNSYYLMFAGFTIISMSVYSFYRILENDDSDTLKNPHFWFSFVLLFFWSTTFINWTLYRLLGQKMIQLMPYIGGALLLISTITYLSLGLIYFWYPKRKQIE
jgi:hypothetical protein